MAGAKNANFVEEDVRILFGIIADEETTIGFLLAGVGESFGVFRKPRSFLMVKNDTCINDVQDFFVSLYQRNDVGIILVGADLFQYVLPVIQNLAHKTLPIVLKIPTKSSMTGPLKLKNQEDKTKAFRKSKSSRLD